jgi:hypothetical protein
LVCDVIKRSKKRIKTSKFQSCRVTAGNGKTSNGAPRVELDFGATGLEENIIQEQGHFW